MIRATKTTQRSEQRVSIKDQKKENRLDDAEEFFEGVGDLLDVGDQARNSQETFGELDAFIVINEAKLFSHKFQLERDQWCIEDQLSFQLKKKKRRKRRTHVSQEFRTKRLLGEFICLFLDLFLKVFCVVLQIRSNEPRKKKKRGKGMCTCNVSQHPQFESLPKGFLELFYLFQFLGRELSGCFIVRFVSPFDPFLFGSLFFFSSFLFLTHAKCLQLVPLLLLQL